jgi:Uma2 family endonuclease
MSTAAVLDEDASLPAEAPRAPTEEAWTRMSPAEREQAVDALLASESVEENEERLAMAEGDPHLDAKTSIRATLRSHFGRLGRKIYVGADIGVYYPGQKVFTPDVIAVSDVEPRARDAWIVTAEGKGVDLALEVHYKGNWQKDFVGNVTKYAGMGIREYFIYDIRRQILRGYRLPRAGAAYEGIPSRGARLRSRVLQLDIALEDGAVRFYEGSAILVTEAELVGKLETMIDAATARAEAQAARADEQATRADAQATRADQAAARLGSAVVTILGVRGIQVDADARARILGVTDVPTLERWLDRATTVATCPELFAEG